MTLDPDAIDAVGATDEAGEPEENRLEAAEETDEEHTEEKPPSPILGLSFICLGLLVVFELVSFRPATGPVPGGLLIVAGILFLAWSGRAPRKRPDGSDVHPWQPEDSDAVAATTQVLVALQELLDCSDPLRVGNAASNLLTAIHATTGNDALKPAFDRIHPALRMRLSALERAVSEVLATSRNGGSPTGVGIPDSARDGIEEFREWVTTRELRLTAPEPQ